MLERVKRFFGGGSSGATSLPTEAVMEDANPSSDVRFVLIFFLVCDSKPRPHCSM